MVLRGLCHHTWTQTSVSKKEVAASVQVRVCASTCTLVLGWGVDEVESEWTCLVHLLPPVASYAHPSVVAGGVRGAKGHCWLRDGPPCSASPVHLPPPACPTPSPPLLPPAGLRLFPTAPALFHSPPLSSLCAHPALPTSFVTSVGPPSPVLLHPWVSLAPAPQGPPAELPGGCPNDSAGRHLPLPLGVCGERVGA